MFFFLFCSMLYLGSMSFSEGTLYKRFSHKLIILKCILYIFPLNYLNSADSNKIIPFMLIIINEEFEYLFVLFHLLLT